jgi:hypothetical protein
MINFLTSHHRCTSDISRSGFESGPLPIVRLPNTLPTHTMPASSTAVVSVAPSPNRSPGRGWRCRCSDARSTTWNSYSASLRRSASRSSTARPIITNCTDRRARRRSWFRNTSSSARHTNRACHRWRAGVPVSTFSVITHSARRRCW